MHLIESHILTIIIFVPILGAGLLVAVPSGWKIFIRLFSFILALAVLAAISGLFILTNSNGDFKFVETVPWIPVLNIFYRIGIDGVSLLLILLTALLIPLAMLSSWREEGADGKRLHISILVIETALLGLFSSLDLFLFYSFWGVTLIPLYFLISKGRDGEGIKFFTFLMIASVFMLAAFLLTAAKTGGSWNLVEWYLYKFDMMDQLFLFVIFTAAFGILLPMIPVHTWFVGSVSRSSTAGGIILAGLVTKVGFYGFYRLVIPIFPMAVVKFSPIILSISTLCIIYSGLIAAVNKDIKQIAAYISISQAGFIFLGLFSVHEEAIRGSLVQIFNHGLSISAMILVVGMLLERGFCKIADNGAGLARAFPIIAIVSVLTGLSLMAIPLFNNFVGLFLILLGAFQTKTIYAAVALSGLMIQAIYILRFLSKTFFGKLSSEDYLKSPDIRMREFWMFVPIIILVISIGLWPKPWLCKIDGPADMFMKLSKRIEITGVK